MLFTGSSLTITRSLYTQTGQFGFNMDCTVDNTTGRYQFGLSGVQGTIEFKLESGKMYYQNQFIHAYKSFQPFNVDVQVSSGASNVTKDGAPLVYGAPKPTGYFDTFYMKRENAGMSADFDLNISGNNAPLYAISTLGYLLATGQGGVTGYFVNQSRFPVRIFDSNSQASQPYTFGKLNTTLAPAASGRFVYSGDFPNIDLSQPILTTFNTNYSDTTILFTIVDATTLGRFVFLTGPTDFTFNQTGILNRDVTYLNYSGGIVTNAFSSALNFQLKYATGQETFTGVWNMSTGLDSNSLVSLLTPGAYSSGMMSGSGLLPPNSQMTFQISYSGISGNAAQLVISGSEVLNPINQILNQ